LSYAGICHIGINIDTAAVPDPHVLLACLQESTAEIAALGAAGPGADQPGPERRGGITTHPSTRPRNGSPLRKPAHLEPRTPKG